jgi:ABC-type transport system involved in Fe-S cluster assembly, permease and ATPase components
MDEATASLDIEMNWQILVVSDDGIMESGTNDELLARKGKCAAIWNAEQKIST